jgi:putative tricarboxylic transport membrane protein
MTGNEEAAMTDRSNTHLRLNNSELWGGLIGLALGIFVMRSGIKLKLGTINDPGSGYVLFYTGILMCVFALTIVFAALTEGGASFGSRWEGARWTRPVIVIACLIAFSLALEPLGFLLSSIPLMLLLLRTVDPVRWTLAVPIAVLVPLGAWWVLKHVLLIQLPSGVFGIG